VRVIRRIAPFLALAMALGALAGCSAPPAAPPPTADSASAANPVVVPAPAPPLVPTPSPTPAFDMGARSIDDPDSIWVVVDKQRPLDPQDYSPADLVDVPVAHTWDPLLRREAADAVVRMFDAAREEAGLELASNSAYRSYDTQVGVYNGDVSDFGQEHADANTARPGNSEHQTGLAVDIGAASGDCSLDVCFAATDEGQWLAENAWRFGFLLRYPADKVAVTGFAFEPWHYRYVGEDLTAELHATGVTTLEEFFGLAHAPDYP
jgi:D-alanyl-D-alanine carboxypeptidase